jgi:hypothetical protein
MMCASIFRWFAAHKGSGDLFLPTWVSGLRGFTWEGWPCWVHPTQGFCGLYRSGKIAGEEGLASREGRKRIRKARKEKDPNAAALSLEGLDRQIERFLKPGNKVAQGGDI